MKQLFFTFLFLSLVIFLNAQPTSQFWGLASQGGISNRGTIFQTNDSGWNAMPAYNFKRNPSAGGNRSKLVEASNGKLYGLTFGGGIASTAAGTLFEFDPATNQYTHKKDFTGLANGYSPIGGLLRASDGKLYGMTSQGGSLGFGNIFQYDPITDVMTVKANFDFSNSGANPWGTLVEGPGGKLYGMNQSGGAYLKGVLFVFDITSSSLTKLLDFDGVNTGGTPKGSLLYASDGKLYGMTQTGGANNLGVIFKFDPSNNLYTKILDFGSVNGKSPSGSLIEPITGVLFGIGDEGSNALNDNGSIFSYNLSSGIYNVVYTFNNGEKNPRGDLYLANDGNLYGTAYSGGANNKGVFFQFNPITNSYTKKFDFTGVANGANSMGTIMQASNGKLYGMTTYGGTANQGVIFEYDLITSANTKKCDFYGAIDGYSPLASMTQGTNGNLYGMTNMGGAFNYGVIFEFDPGTHVYTKKIDLDSITSGSFPEGSLCLGSNGKFYGLTAKGGINNFGVLFEYDPTTNGVTKKVDFSFALGIRPYGTLLNVGNKLYGMTSGWQGKIFEYNFATSTYSIIHSYTTSIGDPRGSLLLASDGNLYGVIPSGGSGTFGGGALFQYDVTNNLYTEKINSDNVNSSNSGALGASCKLMQASNGNLYGTTNSSGVYYAGTLFEYNPTTNAIAVKYQFSNVGSSAGSYPSGGLIQASNGKLYGLNSDANNTTPGRVFQYDPVSNACDLTSMLSNTIGSWPQYGELIEILPSLSTTSINPIICAGGYVSVAFAASGNFPSGNVFTAQLSDASGSFLSPVSIGTVTSSVSGTINAVIPPGTLAGNGYRIRVVCSTPSFTVSDNGSNLSINSLTIPTLSVADGTICAGTNYTLSPTGATTYSFSGGSAVVNPTTTTSYIISGTGSNGCIGFDTALVVVNPRPTITVNSGVLCSGSLNSFTITPSGAATYTIQGGTAIVSPTTNTTYTVIGTNTAGCISQIPAAAYVNIVPNPTISVNSGSICIGQSFTIIPSGASTYTFQGGSSLVSPTSTSVYTVMGTNSFGCVSQAFATTTVIVNPTPIPTITVNSGSICLGNTFVIVPAGASNYTFSGWWGYSSSGLSATVSPNYPNFYSVIGSNSVGCISSSPATSTVSFFQTPYIYSANESICFGQTFTIIPATYGVVNSYTIEGGTAIVSPTSSTSYTIMGTSSDGCLTAFPGTIYLTVNPNPTITVNSGTVCTGQTFTLLPTGADTYTFEGGNSIISPTTSASYTVAGSSNAGCAAVSPVTSSVTVYISPTISVNSGSICAGEQFTIVPSGAITYTFEGGSDLVSPVIDATYSVSGTSLDGCVSIFPATSSITVFSVPTISISNSSICAGDSFTLAPSGANTYTFSSGSNIVSPSVTTSYSITGTSTAGCLNTYPTTLTLVVLPLPTLTAVSQTVCIGSSTVLSVNGAASYIWNTGATNNTLSLLPSATTIYSVSGIGINGCTNTTTVAVIVNSTCANVWPGDANSDGQVDNLDILELGLHYTLTGLPRTIVSDLWQPYYSDNWLGNLTNGDNVNHSDCNGDGIINQNDTLAIYLNYGLTHAFREASQTNEITDLSIVANQNYILKGQWGSSSILLGDATNPITDLNGLAFTLHFDSNLIEQDSIFLEYPYSFLNNNGNLNFNKRVFNTGVIYTASTHTNNINTSGYGLVAILHYKVSHNLSSDQQMVLQLDQVHKSSANGEISSLSSNSHSIQLFNQNVSLNEYQITHSIAVFPIPTEKTLMISGLKPTQRIELINPLGQILYNHTITENNKSIYELNMQDFDKGAYYIIVYTADKVGICKKIIKD